MKKRILFYADTSFQLLYSFIINELIFGDYSTFLIARANNERINKMAIELKSFKNVWAFNRSKKSNYLTRILEEKKNIDLIVNILNTKKPDILIVFKDNDPICKSLIDIASKNGTKIILIQEGLALYGNIKHKTRKKIKVLAKKIIQTMLRYPIININQGEDPRISVMVVSHMNSLSEKRKTNKEIIEFPNIQPPTFILEKFINETKLDFNNLKHIRLNKTLIYFGQPLSENEFDKKNEKMFLDELFKILSTSGYQIIVKPHPSENMDKYSIYPYCTLYTENYIPAEILAFIVKPVLVLTPYSSVGLNISTWYPTTIIYLYKLLLDLNLEIENEVLLNNNNCHIIKDYDELSMLLTNDFSLDETQIPNMEMAELLYKDFVNKIIN